MQHKATTRFDGRSLGRVGHCHENPAAHFLKNIIPEFKSLLTIRSGIEPFLVLRTTPYDLRYFIYDIITSLQLPAIQPIFKAIIYPDCACFRNSFHGIDLPVPELAWSRKSDDTLLPSVFFTTRPTDLDRLFSLSATLIILSPLRDD